MKLPYHELDHFESSSGCAGIGQCESCDRHLTEQTMQALALGIIRPGNAVELPYHFLLVWDDSTFTALPKVPSSLN